MMADQTSETITASTFIKEVMASTEYKEFMKSLMAEVIEEKIIKRLEKCESDIHDLVLRVDALEEINNDNSDLTEDISNLEEELNDLQQYSRRNSLRISDIPEKANENTNDIVKSLAHEKLGVSVEERDIDRSHRVGKRNDHETGSKHRQILVKFTNYSARSTMIRSRYKLKGTGITIHENLTRKNQNLLVKTSKKHGVVSAWSKDGKIFAAVPSTTPGQTVKMIIKSRDDLNKVPKVDDKAIELCRKEQRSRSRSHATPMPQRQTGMSTRARTGSLR